MKLTKDNKHLILEILQMEGLGGFEKDHLIKIEKVLKKEFDNLSGKFYSTYSGGGFEHMFFQLKDLRWIGFHNSNVNITGVNGGVTVSKKPYKTQRSHESHFFSDDESNNENYFHDKVTKAEYLDAVRVLERWCKQKKQDVSILYPRGK